MRGRRFVGFLRSPAWLALVFALPIGIAHAGAISINVVDAVTATPLAGVTVTAEDRSGETRNTVTGADGAALFEDLDEGFYRFRAESEGYLPGTEPAVRILTRRTERLRFELQRQEAALDTIVVVGRRAIGADPNGSVADRYLARDELRKAPGSGSEGSSQSAPRSGG